MAFTFSTVTKLARKGALQQKLKSLFTYKVSSPPSLFQLKQALHQACWGAPTRGNESLRIVLLLLTASNYLLPHNAKDYKLYSLNSDMFGLVIPVTLDKLDRTRTYLRHQIIKTDLHEQRQRIEMTNSKPRRTDTNETQVYNRIFFHGVETKVNGNPKHACRWTYCCEP